ncbi:hypothetical protein CLV62_101321 [Dysgonomonas alginatilytica]|uniref:Lipoprotein n=1 Tax=Dysgonomonas alginatilytica TaxID=1605892 RepID=A0A2V3PVA3_9BACT|nr:hypothetical protein [Dysgonomonas alginatilytica]PXV69052.1 hypothetical protein CLV62_101321 [Dysgonomonas alginatilytica]
MLLKVKGLLSVLVMACMFSACGLGDNEKFYLTNPTDKSIEVEIADQKYTVEPNGIVELNLTEGTYTMVLPDKETVKFKVFQNSTGGIINPTKSPHVIFTMIYVVDDKAASSFMPPTNVVLIDGVEYEGPIRTTDAMFIDNNIYRCTYPVGQPFPEVLTVGDQNSKGNMKSKFFTKNEFVDFFSKEAVGDANFHEDNKTAGGETTITEKQSLVFPVADFENKELQEQANKLIATIKGYMDAETGSEQEKFQKQYHDNMMALVNAHKDYTNVVESQKYNDFVGQAGSFIGLGIVEL